jgi:hypothetical protein
MRSCASASAKLAVNLAVIGRPGTSGLLIPRFRVRLPARAPLANFRTQSPPTLRTRIDTWRQKECFVAEEVACLAVDYSSGGACRKKFHVTWVALGSPGNLSGNIPGANQL